jgi:hypothetical protein
MTDMTTKTETRIPVCRIQKLIGERMLESKRTKPCCYIGIKADTTELMDSRHELKKRLGVKFTLDEIPARLSAQFSGASGLIFRVLSVSGRRSGTSRIGQRACR